MLPLTCPPDYKNINANRNHLKHAACMAVVRCIRNNKTEMVGNTNMHVVTGDQLREIDGQGGKHMHNK